MSDPVYRLVYYSENRLNGDQAQVIAGIEQILAASRKNNVTVGVTGALMFNSDYFAQVLEGPQKAVEATFERIQQDERHGSVSLLSFTPAERVFDKWSMAFVGGSAAEAAEFESVGERSGFDPSTMTGERVFEILHSMLLQDQAVAA